MEDSLLEKIKKKVLHWNKDRSNTANSQGKLSFFQWMVILACLGLAAMILHDFLGFENKGSSLSSPLLIEEETVETVGKVRDGPKTIKEYEEWYENQLTEILSTIVGVSDVTVMVNLESTEEIVVEKNTRIQDSKTIEQDREGGNREIVDSTRDEQVVIIRDDHGEQPVVLMTRKPQVRGVLVVAKGAENAQVKAWITEAVQRVLHVQANRVSVLPKKS